MMMMMMMMMMRMRMRHDHIPTCMCTVDTNVGPHHGCSAMSHRSTRGFLDAEKLGEPRVG